MNQFYSQKLPFYYTEFTSLLYENIIDVTLVFMFISLYITVAIVVYKSRNVNTVATKPKREVIKPETNPYAILSINLLIDKRDELSKNIANIAKVIAERNDAIVEYKYFDITYEDESDDDLEYSLEYQKMLFNLVDEVLTQKQYDIYYYLNADKDIPSERKLYDQIEFIEKLPPDELGHDGVKFRLNGTVYTVRKIDYYYQSDTIREAESLIIL